MVFKGICSIPYVVNSLIKTTFGSPNWKDHFLDIPIIYLRNIRYRKWRKIKFIPDKRRFLTVVRVLFWAVLITDVCSLPLVVPFLLDILGSVSSFLDWICLAVDWSFSFWSQTLSAFFSKLRTLFSSVSSNSFHLRSSSAFFRLSISRSCLWVRNLRKLHVPCMPCMVEADFCYLKVQVTMILTLR